MLDVQVATHLKGLAKKAKLNESHAKAARAYKAMVASLTSEQGQVQRMTEEVVKLKSDLKHTTSACSRAEGREDKARNNLRATESELREVRDDLRAAQNDLLRLGTGCSLPNMNFRWLGMSFSHPKASFRSLKKNCVRSKMTCVIRRCCWTGLVARPPRLPARRNA